jgi:hypothetical protein
MSRRRLPLRSEEVSHWLPITENQNITGTDHFFHGFNEVNAWLDRP